MEASTSQAFVNAHDMSVKRSIDHSADPAAAKGEPSVPSANTVPLDSEREARSSGGAPTTGVEW